MTEQAIHLRSSTAILRRRWRLLSLGAALGLVLGVAYAVLAPPRMSSTALVLLPDSAASADASKVAATQTAIATSAVVLERAGARVTPRLTARQVDDRINVTTPTDQLLQIEAHATSAKQAQAIAEAVASSYVEAVSQLTIAAISSQTNELESRKQGLTTELNAVTAEIKATSARLPVEGLNSPGGLKDGQVIAQLRGQQAALSLTLDQVTSALDSAQVLQNGNSQTKVVQPAAPATGDGLSGRLLVALPPGLLVPVLLISLVVLLRARRDPRLRTQDQLADAVGGTVIAGVVTLSQKATGQWSTLLGGHQAQPVEEWALRRALSALAAVDPDPFSASSRSGADARIEHPRSILVVTVAGDDRALAVGPQLAAFTASRGVVTRLVASVGAEHAPSLWAACAADRDADLRDALTVDTWLNGDDSTGPDPGAARNRPAPAQQQVAPELTVVLAVVDQDQPSFTGVPATSVSVLAVAPGVATRVGLARVAVALDDTGRTIDGVIVADPDPEDLTTGHRQLRRRALELPLPMRLTGFGAGGPLASEDEGATV